MVMISMGKVSPSGCVCLVL